MFREAALHLVPVVSLGLLVCPVESLAELVNGEELIDPTAPFLLNVESTQPLANVFATLTDYKVSSILIRENVRVAVINSERVKEGEFIGNARVVSIEPNEVTIDIDGDSRVLKLRGETIKTRSEE